MYFISSFKPSLLFHWIAGLIFLAVSQVFIQANIFADINNSWKSLGLFQVVQERRSLYYLIHENESTLNSLILSVGGSLSYATNDQYSWILLMPWVVNCLIFWISSSYLSINSLLVSFTTEDFWKTFILMVLTIILKGLLVSEVMLKSVESILKFIAVRKDAKTILEGVQTNV